MANKRKKPDLQKKTKIIVPEEMFWKDLEIETSYGTKKFSLDRSKKPIDKKSKAGKPYQIHGTLKIDGDDVWLFTGEYENNEGEKYRSTNACIMDDEATKHQHFIVKAWVEWEGWSSRSNWTRDKKAQEQQVEMQKKLDKSKYKVALLFIENFFKSDPNDAWAFEGQAEASGPFGEEGDTKEESKEDLPF